jgi:hypothetical protein
MEITIDGYDGHDGNQEVVRLKYSAEFLAKILNSTAISKVLALNKNISDLAKNHFTNELKLESGLPAEWRICCRDSAVQRAERQRGVQPVEPGWPKG